MSYQEVFIEFWKKVEESIQEGNFAKLTMAKTIGKQELKNIFVRPMSLDSDAKLLVKHRYRSREVEDKELELSLAETRKVIEEHLLKPFFSVVLFTTEKDIMFKINKKKAGSIVENQPTFSDVILAEKDLD